LTAIGQTTSESDFGSFAFLDPFGDSVLVYLHDPGEIVEESWRLRQKLDLFPNMAVRDTSLSLIQSSLGTLEAIVRVTPLQGGGNDSLLGYEFRSETGWEGPVHLVADDGPLDRVTGSQAFIQSDRNSQDQFELLVPRKAEIFHYKKEVTGITEGPWEFVAKLPPLQGGLQVTAVSFLQSSPSELVAIARVSPPNPGYDVLLGYVFDQVNGWQGPLELKSDQGPIDVVTGSHAFIQSGENAFELVVPRETLIQSPEGVSKATGLFHYRLENQKFQEGIWSFVNTFVPPRNDELIQSTSLALTHNTLGHLELVVRMRPPLGEDFMVGYVLDQEIDISPPPFELLDENGQSIIARDSSTLYLQP